VIDIKEGFMPRKGKVYPERVCEGAVAERIYLAV